ncbi:MAG: AgmX/PglI C-terminal domain-containing protein, partial [Kofleriaceae bacterium]
AARPAQMSADDAQRFAQILSGHDEVPGGTGTMRARQPGGDLAEQIAEIRDHGATAVVGNDPRAGRPPARLGTGPTRIADDPGQLARQPERREEAREVRLALRPEAVPSGEQTTLTVEVVLARIRGSYLDVLQRCYKKGLASDGALSGKIALAFTVTETGRLADISARGLTPEVDACIRAQMSSWRFPIPRDGDREATEAAFALALALQAS